MTFLHSSITMAVFKILQRELYKKKKPANVGISTVFVPFAFEGRKKVSLSSKI